MPPQATIFLVTGLHTKRRPSEYPTIKSTQVLRVQVPMSRKSMRMSARKIMVDEGSDVNQTKPIRPPATKSKFVPKPLILVERMKVRRQLLGLPPTSALKLHVDSPEDAEPGKAIPKCLERATLTTSLTPEKQTTPGRVPCCGSHSPNTTSARCNLRNNASAALRCSFCIARASRLSSTVFSDFSPSSTDTFVDNSPSCTKRLSKVQLLTEILPGFELAKLDDRPRVSDFGVTAFMPSVARQTCQLTDTFGPAITTPLTSSQPKTNKPSSSSAYSPIPLHETLGLPDNCTIAAPTSCASYCFNAAPDSYIVKLPDPRPTASLSRSNRTSIASTATTTVSYSERGSGCREAKGTVDGDESKRSLNRVMSPTLVLDGIFAISRTSALVSPRKSIHGPLPTPKLTPRRRPSLSDATNTTQITPPRAHTISRAVFAHGSPRSRLARVLSMSTNQNVDTNGESNLKTPHMRKSYVPPLIMSIKASIDPVTQSEIEALRSRGRALVGDDAGIKAGFGALDSSLSLAPVGRVAKLKERWERGAVGLGKE